ncbi:MAG: PepSY domain-containing protein [Gemmatimonadota bacterium]
MQTRTLHKWIGILIGLVLLMWTVTGIIMVLPGNRSRQTAKSAPLDVASAIISPAAALVPLGDSIAPVKSVELIPILDRVAYRIEGKGRTVLIDAKSGERIQVTPDAAREIAVRALRGRAGKARVETLTKHDARYPSGDLPVYRVILDDSAATVSYVSPGDGSIVSGDSRNRIRSVAGRLHDFSVVTIFVKSQWFHRSLIILASLVAIGGIVTGYWLALPRPRPTTTRQRVTVPMSRSEK